MHARYAVLAATFFVLGLSTAQAQPTSSPAVEVESAAGTDLFRVMDDGRLHVPVSAAAGYVLTSDADGYATWQMPPAGGTGFSLPFVGSGSAAPLLHLTSTADGGLSSAILGEATGTNGIGLLGRTTDTGMGSSFGVWGEIRAQNGAAVRGAASSETGTTRGVLGISASTQGIGVYGLATATTGTSIGLLGITNSPSGWAGYFDGRLHVSGRTGIGTTAPAANLHVQDNSTLGIPHLLLRETTADDYARLRLANTNATGFWDVAGGGADLDRLNIFRSGAGDLVTIRSSGNVGIGTTNPAARLDVAGTVRTERVQYTEPRTQYASIGGPSFQPQVMHPGTQYIVLAGNGGAYYTAESVGWGMAATIQLPHGAVLQTFQPRIYDNAALDLRCALSRHLFGGFYPLAETTSSGTPGYVTPSEPVGGHIVDNRDASYTITCNPVGGDWELARGDLRIQGVTIEYTLTEAQ